MRARKKRGPSPQWLSGKKESDDGAILKLFDKMGLHFDCSSVFEVRRAMAAGVAAYKCSLSSQELTDGFEELVALGVKINCCSLLQVKYMKIISA